MNAILAKMVKWWYNAFSASATGLASCPLLPLASAIWMEWLQMAAMNVVAIFQQQGMHLVTVKELDRDCTQEESVEWILCDMQRWYIQHSSSNKQMSINDNSQHCNIAVTARATAASPTTKTTTSSWKAQARITVLFAVRTRSITCSKISSGKPYNHVNDDNNNNSNAVYCTHCCPICGGSQKAAILCNQPHIHLHCNCVRLLLLLALPVAIFAVFCCHRCLVKAGSSGGCRFLKKFSATIVAIMLYCCHSCFCTFAAPSPLYYWCHFCCCSLLSLLLPSFPVAVDCCFLLNCNRCALANAAATNCCCPHYNMMFAAPQCCKTPVVATCHCFCNY